MRTFRISVLVLVTLAGPLVATSWAVSLDDLMGLKKKGVSEAVLLALIESDATVFRLSSADVLKLRDAGFTDGFLITILQAETKDRQMREAEAAAQLAFDQAQRQQQAEADAIPPLEPVADGASVAAPAPGYINQSPVFVAQHQFGSGRRATQALTTLVPTTSVVASSIPTTGPVFFVAPLGNPILPGPRPPVFRGRSVPSFPGFWTGSIKK
jgi:type II secretory pathway pseudopilin PulG